MLALFHHVLMAIPMVSGVPIKLAYYAGKTTDEKPAPSASGKQQLGSPTQHKKQSSPAGIG